MRVPHLLNKFVSKWRSTRQQFINTDGECILVGVASWIALPLFRWHVGSSTGDFAQRCMGLHSQIEGRAEIGEQNLSIASNEQVAGFNILVNETILVNVIQRGCRLLDIRHKLFGVCKPPATIFFAKEVMNSFRCVLHHQIGSSILYLPEVVDWKDVGVLQMSNALCLVKETISPFFIELFGTQHLERKYAAEWRGFTYLVDMTVGACAN